MRYLFVATLCLGFCSTALGQSSTTSVGAAGSPGYVQGTASAGFSTGPNGCFPQGGEDNNYGTVSLSIPQGGCDAVGQELSVSCSSTNFVPPGTYTVQGTYSGFSGADNQDNPCSVPGSTATATVVVPQAGTTTYVYPPQSLTFQAGQVITLPVQVIAGNNFFDYVPTGNVTLQYGSHELFPQQLNYGTYPVTTATISGYTKGVPPGTYNVDVAYGGDANFLPSSSTYFGVTILPAQLATTSTLSISPNPLVKGDETTLAVSISPSGLVAPTGSVTILAGSTPLTTIAASNGFATATLPANVAPGTYSIQALYSGDSFNLPSTSSPVSVTVVAQTATATTVAVTPTTIIEGQPAQISTSVTPTIGDTPPSGTVTITAGGRTVTTLPLKSGSASLNLSTSGVPAGTYNVIGTYNGSATATSSTSAPQTVVIVPASTVALTASPNPVKQGSITTLTAVVKTGNGTPVTSGTITFSYSGNSLGTATLNSSGTAQLPIATSSFATGTYTIQASYPGSGNIPAATGSVPLVVN